MIERKIKLSTMEEIKEFNTIVNQCNMDADIIAGRYIIDAKSVMGLFSIDLSEPVILQLHGKPDDVLLDKLEKFIAQ